MNERKYTGTELAKALCAAHNDANAKANAKAKANANDYTYDDIMTLALAWAEHPRYPSPQSNTLYVREQKHGELWLKLSEIPSFQLYIGYNLIKHLD